MNRWNDPPAVAPIRNPRSAIRNRRLLLLAAMAGIALCALAGLPVRRTLAAPAGREYVPQRPFRVALDFKHFYDDKALADAMRRLAEAFPELTRLSTMGKSRGGRDLWIMEITNRRTGEAARKPALYIDGNIHGNEIQAAEVALFTIWYLLNRYGDDPYVTRLLDTRAFYIAPTVNPDARAAFFRDPNTAHSPRWNQRPVDNDRDGQLDEDGYEDIDGDGRILMMRKRDPMGSMKTGPDRRSMVPVRFGEQGEWRLLGNEGIDNDGDGRVNEDAPGGVDLNRNYPIGWEPEGVQFGAGPYPLSEPETAAVAAFWRAHPNIAAAQSYHNAGNYILHPFGDRPLADMPARDRQVYEAISARGQQFLPGYTAGGIRETLYETHGDFLAFAYVAMGAISFTNELWAWPLDYNKDGRVSEEEQLRYNDEMLHGAGFTDWKPFRHPVYGEIEIGGWNQFTGRIPPADYLEEMCQRNCLFTLYHAEMMPEIKVTALSAQPIGGELVRVEATVSNLGHMDSAPEFARQSKTVPPVIVELEVPDGTEVLAGGAADEFSPDVDQQVDRTPGARRKDARRLELPVLRGQSRQIYRWLIRRPAGARGPLAVRVTSRKGGSDRRAITP